MTEAVLAAIFVGALATLSAGGWRGHVSWITGFLAALLVTATLAKSGFQLEQTPLTAWAVAALRLISFAAAFAVAVRGSGSKGVEADVWVHLKTLLRKMSLVHIGLYVFALFVWGMTVLGLHYGLEIGPRL